MCLQSYLLALFLLQWAIIHGRIIPITLDMKYCIVNQEFMVLRGDQFRMEYIDKVTGPPTGWNECSDSGVPKYHVNINNKNINTEPYSLTWQSQGTVSKWFSMGVMASYCVIKEVSSVDKIEGCCEIRNKGLVNGDLTIHTDDRAVTCGVRCGGKEPYHVRIILTANCTNTRAPTQSTSAVPTTNPTKAPTIVTTLRPTTHPLVSRTVNPQQTAATPTLTIPALTSSSMSASMSSSTSTSTSNSGSNAKQSESEGTGIENMLQLAIITGVCIFVACFCLIGVLVYCVRSNKKHKQTVDNLEIPPMQIKIQHQAEGVPLEALETSQLPCVAPMISTDSDLGLYGEENNSIPKTSARSRLSTDMSMTEGERETSPK